MKVLLGMSGGVDSCAAAILLKNEGHEVIGASIRFYNFSDNNFYNPNLEKSIADAEKFANLIGIKHFIVDAQKEFKDIVINYFTTEYLNARTPFPCVICNSEVKWPILLKKMKELKCDCVATGHYVNKVNENGKLYILKGIDANKDQSFFLWPLKQEILKNTIFPLGNIYKSEVKKIIAHLNSEIPEKKESTGICFLKDSDYRPFLNDYMKYKNIEINKGNFINRNREIIGKHDGYPFYTIGQRRGLKLKEHKTSLFIEQINPNSNEIILNNKTSLNKSILWIKNYRVVNKNDFINNIDIKVRYRKQLNKGKVEFIDDNNLKICLENYVDSIAPGQTTVFYDNNKLLGGGFIERGE